MKRYPVSMARERMADMLDEVERTGAAVIERGDVQYVITVKRRARRSRAHTAMIEVIDPAVAAGQWRWDWAGGSVAFKSAATRRRKR
jgi:hypothetical protein